MCWPSHVVTFSSAVSVSTVGLAASQQGFLVKKFNYLHHSVFQFITASHIDDHKGNIHIYIFLLGCKGGRCVRLTTLSPSHVDSLETQEVSMSSSPTIPYRSVKKSPYLYIYILFQFPFIVEITQMQATKARRLNRGEALLFFNLGAGWGLQYAPATLTPGKQNR
jgi:hypothetical protein